MQKDNILFYYGAESYFIELEKKAFSEKVKKTDSSGFNVDKFRGTEFDLARARSAALSMPMMSDMRFIIIENLQEHYKGRIAKAAQTDFEKFIESLPETTTVLITANIEKKKYKSFPWAFLIKNSKNKEFPKIYDDKLTVAIKKILAEKKISLDDKTISYLVYRFGSDFGSIELEIDKILNFAEDKDDMSFPTLRPVLNVSPVASIDSLTSAMVNRDKSALLSSVYLLSDSGEQPVFIVAVIWGYYYKLFKFLDAKSKYQSLDQQAKAIGTVRFFANDYVKGSGRYSTFDLEKILLNLAKIDYKLKSENTNFKDLLNSYLISEL
ncbi:MAG: DNA polymerase III subunit delta [Candidatus Kapaibacteriales bacterium]